MKLYLIYMKMAKVSALILARGGSKSIPHKNVTLLDGKPLIVRTIDVLKGVKGLDSIWVSTDDDIIEKISKANGANIHRRASYTATDRASSLTAVKEFLSYHNDISILCLVQCTSVFFKSKYLEYGLAKISEGCDSIFTVTRRHLLRWSEGPKPIAQNFDPKNRPCRQDWSGELYENGMFYIAKTSVIDSGYLQGGCCGYVEIPEIDSIDVDTELDLLIAQQIILKQKEQSKIEI